MGKVTIKEYLMNHAGKASVVLHEPKKDRSYHIGYSMLHKDTIFYFLLDGTGVKGPYYFNLSEAYINRILSKAMSSKFASNKTLTE